MSLLPGDNLVDLLHRRVQAGPGRTAMLRKQAGAWLPVSWLEYQRQVFEIAMALRKDGVQGGERVAIVSQNRPEWAFTDLAVLSLGGITVPVYPSVTADDIAFIFKDCGVSFAFVEGGAQREKILALKGLFPELKGVVSYDEPPVESGLQDYRRWTKDAVAHLGNAETEFAFWKEESSRLDRDLPATIVYTSGTESEPKGVVLSHGNFLAVMKDAASAIKIGEQDLTLLFLPVAHIIGRVEQMLALGVGWTNAYATGQNSFMDNLIEVRPTLLFGVPRVFEKIRHSAVYFLGHSVPLVVRDRLADFILGFGKRYSQKKRTGRKPVLLSTILHEFMDRLVFSRLRARFGGRLRFAVCGGAPLAEDVAEFFHACGVLICEGYGLTETTGPLSLNTPQAFRFGTVGRCLPSVQVRIAPDGEILHKGPTLYKGYYGRKERAEDFDHGWFRTGDIGHLDNEGYLKITDRKKDVIVLSNGKNVAPVRVENLLKSVPLFSHVLVAGDRRSYLTALLTLNLEPTRRFCQKKRIPFRSLADLVADERFLKEVKALVEGVNGHLAPFEKVRRFRVLPRDLSIEAGELTPTYKVKRVFCTRKYAEWIEEMYR